MSAHPKDPCPCGSGKRYKHCHQAADQARKSRGLRVGLSVVAALVLGVGAWGAVRQWQAGQPATGLEAGGDSLGAAAGGPGDVSGVPSPAPTARDAFGRPAPGTGARPPIPAAPGGAIVSQPGASNALAPGEHPEPWQFDMARNRHYDPRPGHQHWHNGPPPADTAQAGSTPQVTVGGGGASVTTTTVPGAPQSMSTTGSEALAPGENPAPWEYDRARDRHFDPRDAHRHWHAGPPPPVSERGK